MLPEYLKQTGETPIIRVQAVSLRDLEAGHFVAKWFNVNEHMGSYELEDAIGDFLSGLNNQAPFSDVHNDRGYFEDLGGKRTYQKEWRIESLELPVLIEKYSLETYGLKYLIELQEALNENDFKFIKSALRCGIPLDEIQNRFCDVWSDPGLWAIESLLGGAREETMNNPEEADNQLEDYLKEVERLGYQFDQTGINTCYVWSN